MQRALSVMSSRGEVCLLQAPESATAGARAEPAVESGVELRGSTSRTPSASTPESGVAGIAAAAAEQEEHLDYVAFIAESGSISKMAIVRRRLARVVGRYLLGEPIAAGGMATVHLGRLVGPAGFSRTVAVKRLHAHLASDPAFVQRFVDEARIASRVRHGNVVQTLDVVAVEDELLLVLDYVHGESLARLRRLALAAETRIPPHIASGIVVGVLRGLHAAHEAKSVKGAALDLVHRDVSPQNILVGADGVARVLDFGIAQAAGREAETLRRDIKGKLAYMPPEQVSGDDLDRRADLFAVGVVLWEALAGERLFRGDDAASTMDAIHNRTPARLSERDLGVTAAVDDVLARALAKEASGRYDTADAMARALEAALSPASDREIAEWVEEVAGDALASRAARVAEFERDDTGRSVARLYAAQPSDTPSAPRGVQHDGRRDARRDALVPPPLESVTSQHVTEMRARVATIPTLEMEAARAAWSDGFASVTVEGISQLRPVNTPLVMMSPSASVDEHDVQGPLPSSGATRIGPVATRGSRFATPIPMPFALPKRRGPSVFQLALLVVFPPLIVAIALTGGVGSRASGAGAADTTTTREAPGATMATMAVTAPPVTVPPVTTATAPPVMAPLSAISPSPAEPDTSASADAGVHPSTRSDRKAARPPAATPAARSLPHRKVPRPVPTAVNR